MKKTKQEVIDALLKRAGEASLMANIAIDNKLWNSAASELYYTCFYYILALFSKNGIESKTHTGVRVLFAKHFIKTGIIEVRWSKLFHNLFELRQEGDYGDFFNLRRG